MASLADRLAALHRKAGRWTLAGLPEGADSLVLAELAKTTGGQDIVHVARDGQRLERLQDGLRFFAPEREVLVFPAWDCLPYDRLSPHPDIVAERLETLVRLAAPKKPGAPARLILASAGAVLQKVPPRSLYAEAATVLTAVTCDRDLVIAKSEPAIAKLTSAAPRSFMRSQFGVIDGGAVFFRIFKSIDSPHRCRLWLSAS